MERVTQVEAMPDWRLRVRFADGTAGVVSIKHLLEGPVFQPLKDVAEFARVFVDEFGAVAWPCEADLAPDALYEDIRAQTTVV
jgi:hypothetical protein